MSKDAKKEIKVGCCNKVKLLQDQIKKKNLALVFAVDALQKMKTPESEKALEQMREVYPGLC